MDFLAAMTFYIGREGKEPKQAIIWNWMMKNVGQQRMQKRHATAQRRRRTSQFDLR
jgi:predicted SprT family Zn-dependent metalloprotease